MLEIEPEPDQTVMYPLGCFLPLQCTGGLVLSPGGVQGEVIIQYIQLSPNGAQLVWWCPQLVQHGAKWWRSDWWSLWKRGEPGATLILMHYHHHLLPFTSACVYIVFVHWWLVTPLVFHLCNSDSNILPPPPPPTLAFHIGLYNKLCRTHHCISLGHLILMYYHFLLHELHIKREVPIC